MPQYDLAGNPLPESSSSSSLSASTEPLTDLAGNPLPASAQPAAAPAPNLPLPSSFTLASAPGAYRAAPPAVSSAPAAPSRLPLYIGLGVAAVALLVAIFIFRASSHEPVAAPSGFTAYTAQDNSFVCVAPEGWTKIGAGVQGGNLGGALFEKGDARVDITSDLAGSLMGDIVNIPNPLSNTPPVPPVEKLHKMGKRALKEKYSDYKETAMTRSQGGMGEICTSEWTASGGPFATKRHGWRVTMLGSERRVTVIAESAETDWKKLKPAFERVVRSVTSGPG